MNWNKIIPWFLTIACTIAIVVLAIFLINNINWFKKEAVLSPDYIDSNYRIQIYYLHSSLIKRSVGLFSGFILMLLGLGVAFYTVKENSTLTVEAGWKATLITASPGLIAVLVGSFLIIATIQSKDFFSYNSSPLKNKSEVIKPPVPK